MSRENYYQVHIQNFHDESEIRYNFLLKTYNNIKNSIFDIIDHESMINFAGQIDRTGTFLTKHFYIERDFWPLLDVVNRENISNLIDIIWEILADKSNSDDFLHELKWIFNDHLDVRDNSIFDKNCDNKLFNSYLTHLLKSWGDGSLKEEIAWLCIDHEISEATYHKIIKKIQEYINKIYIPAINRKYEQIQVNRRTLRDNMMKLQDKLEKYQKSMKYIYN